MSNQSGFMISGKSFVNQTGQGVISINLANCSNFTISDCDFDTDTEPIFLQSCSDFDLGWLRARNIVGPHARDGSHRGNLVQMDTCLRYHIHDAKVKGGDTEDVISNYQSGGSSAAAMSVIERIAVDMTGWTSTSGTGIILGDGGGGYTEVRDCSLLNPGQVGIQIIDGLGHKVHDNILYSATGQVVDPNVGISSYGGLPTAEVYLNKVRWYKNSGVENPYWFGAGTINAHDNDWHATIDPATLAVVL